MVFLVNFGGIHDQIPRPSEPTWPLCTPFRKDLARSFGQPPELYQGLSDIGHPPVQICQVQKPGEATLEAGARRKSSLDL